MTPTTTDPERRWGALFWSLIAVLAVVSIAFAATPELARQMQSAADRLAEP